jgi:hypothetical protein
MVLAIFFLLSLLVKTFWQLLSPALFFHHTRRVLVTTMHSNEQQQLAFFSYANFAPRSADNNVVVYGRNIVPVFGTVSSLNKVLSLDHAGSHAG